MMRRLLCLFAAASHAAAPQAAESTDAQVVYDRVSPSVVTVLAFDDRGEREGQGSGVVVGAGLVATNCHVIQDATRLSVEAGQSWPATWVRRAAARDICLLSVAGLNAPGVAMREIGTLKIGEPVYAIGNPLGFGKTVSAGLVSSVSGQGSTGFVVNTAAQSPGSSGGGLFDREGRLVGITTATLGTGQNLNLALATDGIASLPKEGKPLPTGVAPPAAERRWQLEAETLQRTSAWKKLEELALAWRAYDPESAVAMVFHGMAQGELEQKAEALKTLERAVATDDRLGFGWINYAMALHAAGRKEDAERALDRAQVAMPNYALPSELRAGWALQAKNPAKAREEIRKALRLAPGRSVGWRLLGQSEELLGNGNGATAAYRVAQRLGDTSPELAQRLTKQLAEAGKADEASAVAAKATLGRQETARSELAIGLAELKRNRLGPAESALRKATELAPELPETWQGLASALVAGKRLREAEQAMDEALKRSPDNPDLLASRAAVRRDAGNRPGAEEDIRKALGRSPNHAVALRNQVALLIDARNPRAALVVLSKMDSLGVAGPDELISLADCQADTGASADALVTLGRIESKAGNDVRFHLTRGKALGLSGKLQESIASLDAAMRLDPTNQWAWSSKGYAQLRLGRIPEAIETLETAVRLTPDFANAWINLGQAQMQNKNLGRAIAALEKGIALAPEAMDARLYLAQSYLGARIAPKAREQANWLLARQPRFAPAHGILTLVSLTEGDLSGARQNHERLRAISPDMARAIRQQAIVGGVVQAREWAE